MSPSNVLEAHHVEALFSSAASEADLDEYLNASTLYGNKKKDWNALPTVLKKHPALCSRLAPIINNVVGYFYPATTINITPNTRPVEKVPRMTTGQAGAGEYIEALPDFLISGIGVGWMQPLSALRSLVWSQCAGFVDAVIDERAKETASEQLSRFYSFAEQCFTAQPARLFVYGLLVTETAFRLHRFDRSGLWMSSWIPYRRNDAPSLVKALLLASSTKDIDCDPAVTINEHGRHVFCLKKGRHQTTLVGQRLLYQEVFVPAHRTSTACWEVQDSKTGKMYLLKRQLSKDYDPHSDQDIKAFMDRLKGVKGIGRAYFSHQVKIGMAPGRQKIGMDNAAFGDVFVSYTVIEGYGHPINTVSDRAKFLRALRSAITSHGAAFNEKDILHRNISIENILYADGTQNPKSSGTQGHLFGFENALDTTTLAEVHDGARIPIIEQPPNRTFQSINVLRNSDPANPREFKQPHDYLDDLESFFWRCKDGRTHLVFDAQWGQEFINLATHLGRFFLGKLDKKRHCWKTGSVGCLKEEAEECYSTVLGYFDEAIRGLEGSGVAVAQDTMNFGAMVDQLEVPDSRIQHKPSKKRTARATFPSSEKENEIEVDANSPPVKRIRRARAQPSQTVEYDSPQTSVQVLQPTGPGEAKTKNVVAASTLRQSKRLQKSRNSPTGPVPRLK
ncbi:hypothetical protein CVT24_011409 [Panaeolus cyanescens]|uniref:Fungal-type protein kinase domain-containing protein n=1 Tax=Panaeolus cyanescens TaxID=181874 RepID=A0A409VG73_9AGAR|nr:hypothetical protein CVT24_011409 [Panaeolus cyanescens]